MKKHLLLSIERKVEAGLIIKLAMHKERPVTDEVIKNLLSAFIVHTGTSEFYQQLYVQLLLFFTI